MLLPDGTATYGSVRIYVLPNCLSLRQGVISMMRSYRVNTDDGFERIKGLPAIMTGNKLEAVAFGEKSAMHMAVFSAQA